MTVSAAPQTSAVRRACVCEAVTGRCDLNDSWYRAGDKNPQDACGECAPNESRLTWTDVCAQPDIGGEITADGDDTAYRQRREGSGGRQLYGRQAYPDASLYGGWRGPGPIYRQPTVIPTRSRRSAGSEGPQNHLKKLILLRIVSVSVRASTRQGYRIRWDADGGAWFPQRLTSNPATHHVWYISSISQMPKLVLEAMQGGNTAMWTLNGVVLGSFDNKLLAFSSGNVHATVLDDVNNQALTYRNTQYRESIINGRFFVRYQSVSSRTWNVVSMTGPNDIIHPVADATQVYTPLHLGQVPGRRRCAALGPY